MRKESPSKGWKKRSREGPWLHGWRLYQRKPGCWFLSHKISTRFNKSQVGDLVNLDRLVISRKLQNLTQRQMAAQLGIEHSSVPRYESGKVGLSVAMLEKWAEITKTPITWFFEEEKPDKPPPPPPKVEGSPLSAPRWAKVGRSVEGLELSEPPEGLTVEDALAQLAHAEAILSQARRGLESALKGVKK